MAPAAQPVLADTAVLADWLERRRERGQDRRDYYERGVYVVAPAPGGDHALFVTRLLLVLAPAAAARGLNATVGINIGDDREDYRIPDIAVWHPDTPMTSPAFYATALLVVEVLSPGETAGAKLAFYGDRGVAEYLEIDQSDRTVRLLRRTGDTWDAGDRSAVLDLQLTDLAAAVYQ